jgi:hypothetical protein
MPSSEPTWPSESPTSTSESTPDAIATPPAERDADAVCGDRCDSEYRR